MNQQLTVRELFDQVGERMKLRWLAGQRGENRSIQPGGQQSRRPSMAGYLNLIFPNKVQIIGTDELQYLDSLDPRHRWEMIEKIMNFRPAALVITKDQAPPADLHAAANETDTPLWVSSLRGHDLLTYLQYHMARALAPTTTLHGVFMEVYSIGVLITGDAGSGKSELALELITRGHRLIADDAPEFTLIAPDVIDGTCPELLQDCLKYAAWASSTCARCLATPPSSATSTCGWSFTCSASMATSTSSRSTACVAMPRRTKCWAFPYRCSPFRWRRAAT